MQKVNLLVKNKVGQLQKLLFFTLFKVKFFYFSTEFLNIICLDQSQKPHLF